MAIRAPDGANKLSKNERLTRVRILCWHGVCTLPSCLWGSGFRCTYNHLWQCFMKCFETKQVYVLAWLSDLFCKPQKTRTFQMIFPSSRLCKSPCQRSTKAFHYPLFCTPHDPLRRSSIFKSKKYLQTRWMAPLQEQWWLLFSQFWCLLLKIRISEHSFDKILPQRIVWRTLRFFCSMLFQSSFC